MVIWLVNLPQDEASRLAYANTVKRTMAMTLPTAVAREVLQQLASRATSTPELSHFAVEVSWAWLQRDAQSVSVDALLAAWRGCFALHDVINCQYTLKVGTRRGVERRPCSACWTTLRPTTTTTTISPI